MHNNSLSARLSVSGPAQEQSAGRAAHSPRPASKPAIGCRPPQAALAAGGASRRYPQSIPPSLSTASFPRSRSGSHPRSAPPSPAKRLFSHPRSGSHPRSTPPSFLTASLSHSGGVSENTNGTGNLKIGRCHENRLNNVNFRPFSDVFHEKMARRLSKVLRATENAIKPWHRIIFY